MTHDAASTLNGWLAIAVGVISSSVGNVVLSRSLKRVGDLGELRRSRGIMFVVALLLRNRGFLLGVGCMAVAFYSLLFGFSWNDVSLIAPATNALTFIANATAATIFLHERVDGRRWLAAVLVATGVVLMAF